MLEKIKEENIWNRLAQGEKPVILYGMGDGALKILNAFKQYGIKAQGMFASDEFVRGHSFNGMKVEKYSDICQRYDDFYVIMAFAVHDKPMLRRMKEIDKEHEVLAPDVPVAGGGLFTREYISAHEEEFDSAYNLLCDSLSRKTYIDILNFKVSGKIKYLFDCEYQKELVYDDILRFGEEELIVDLGAYDGDTIAEFSRHTKDYKMIYAFEPDAKNFKKLERNTAEMERIKLYNLVAWKGKEVLSFSSNAGRNSKLSKSGIQILGDSVDNVIQQKPTLIKMDIEGTESKAIEGAANTIKECKPKLYICAYHRNEDLFSLPLQIDRLSSGYKFYLRHHPYIPAWETNYYCIPQ